MGYKHWFLIFCTSKIFEPNTFLSWSFINNLSFNFLTIFDHKFVQVFLKELSKIQKLMKLRNDHIQSWMKTTQWIFFFYSSTMYFYGTLSFLSSSIFSCLIFSNSLAFSSCNYLAFWFSISFCFLSCSDFYPFYTICFLSSKACFLRTSFLSCSSFYSSYLISLCLRMAASNSAFSALACSSSIFYFSICC